MQEKKKEAMMEKCLTNKFSLHMKAYFIITNLVVSMIAFSVLIDAQDSDPFGNRPNTGGTKPDGGGTNPGTQPPAAPPGGNPLVPGGEIPDNNNNGLDPDNSENTPDDDNVDVPGGPGGLDINNILKGLNWQSIIQKGVIGAGLFGALGSLMGGDDGAKWGAIAGGIGGAVAGLLESHIGETPAILVGLGVATVIFLLTYRKKSEQLVEFYCLPWQAPIGGNDCQSCNDFKHCSEYMCKSLGQACDVVNPGTEDQKCVWKNPQDVNSPIIKIIEVNKEHKIISNTAVRPPATGVTIERTDQKCIRAFYPLEFTFITRDSSTGVGEPAQCKVDYNLTKGFEEMKYFVGGDNLFKYNHTEKLSLPGPSAINAIAPELKNDGEWTLFIRCKDANGNYNQDAFSVNFCVDKGPDTTPPLIVNTNIPTGNPVQFNQTSINLEVYVNEPSDCRWSREDRDYNSMEKEMVCSKNIWEMNNQQVYTCKTTLTGINDRKENKYFFRCKDQPLAKEGDRNENKQSYQYTIIGTQPLNILSVKPNETIFGATDVIPVTLEIKTDNGYKAGESLCYYYNNPANTPPLKEEDYLLFHDTKSSIHTQRQDLPEGIYVYYLKCVDLGGNAVYTSTKFNVETDRASPQIVRAYRENDLKIVTDESADCSYSHSNCNFEIESGIKMNSIEFTMHTADWTLNKNYYIRCKDKYDNQPNPNSCSIIVRPSLLSSIKETINEFGFSF